MGRGCWCGSGQRGWPLGTSARCAGGARHPGARQRAVCGHGGSAGRGVEPRGYKELLPPLCNLAESRWNETANIQASSLAGAFVAKITVHLPP